MRFSFHDIGEQPKGAEVIVRMRGSSANVLLLDQANFALYRSGGPFVFTGGFQRRTPVTLEVPEDGHWYVVIDLGGFKGKTRGSVEVISPGETESVVKAETGSGSRAGAAR
ncbi:MAG TPA: DUF1883 domain-containing protein [Solirubrobacteraceae bacterium]